MIALDVALWPRWECPRCGEVITGPSKSKGRRCADCLAAPPRRCSRDQRLAIAGVPERYRVEHAQWPSPRDRRPPLAGMSPSNWAGDTRPTISTATLCGTIGAGKTSLAAELLDIALRAGASHGLFIGAADLVDRAMAGEPIQAQAAEVPVLVLDDLGGGHSGKTWELIFRIVKGRHGLRRRTILTTMLTPRQLLEGAGDVRAVDAGADALADRLIGEGYIWRLDGESRRVVA